MMKIYIKETEFCRSMYEIQYLLGSGDVDRLLSILL